jgi:hypothetical protein
MNITCAFELPANDSASFASSGMSFANAGERSINVFCIKRRSGAMLSCIARNTGMIGLSPVAASFAPIKFLTNSPASDATVLKSCHMALRIGRDCAPSCWNMR